MVSVMLYNCMFIFLCQGISLFVYLTVFVNCLLKQFAICLGVILECCGVVLCGWR